MTEIAKNRGRPRQFDVDTGLATALRLFSRHGYDAVGITEICAALGITPTSLYAAYANKFNLFRRAIDVYIADQGQFVSRALTAATTPDNLRSGLLNAAAVQYASGDAKGCPVLDGLPGARDAAVITLLRGHADATQTAIRDRLAYLGDPDAAANAAAILVVMRGLSMSARAGMTRDDLQMAVSRLHPDHGSATP